MHSFLISVINGTHLSLTDALAAAESRDGMTTEWSRGEGGAEFAMQDVKGVVFALTRLVAMKQLVSWQLLNIEEELKLKYRSDHTNVNHGIDIIDM